MTLQKGENVAAHLGIKGRTEAALLPRGFQRVENSENERSLVQEIDQETGEIITYDVSGKDRRVYRTPQQTRADRYALKSVVNSIFPKSETAKCHRAFIPKQQVQILKSSEHNKAHYAGLRRCSSVWMCPLCAAKIAERRRAELVAALATAKSMGMQVLMMTLTVPHGLGDDLNDILDKMLNAWRRVTTGRAGKKMHKLLGIEGTIRALEVTDGDNGFHPHFHILVFAQPTFTINSFKDGYLPLWQDACVKAGLPMPSDEHGLRVDDGSKAAKYVSKWGLEDEMTKGHIKTSKSKTGMTPWDMLRDVLKNDSERSAERFRIYATAFKGRRQLYWSNGLKKRLGIMDATDEELNEMDEDHAIVLATLTKSDWRAVLWSHCEAALLDMAEDRPDEIPKFLKTIKRYYRSLNTT